MGSRQRGQNQPLLLPGSCALAWLIIGLRLAPRALPITFCKNDPNLRIADRQPHYRAVALLPASSRFLVMASRMRSAGFCSRHSRPGLVAGAVLAGTAALGSLIASSPAMAAIQSVRFDGFRASDGDILNFVIHYDDSALVTSSVASLCGPDPSASPAPGCYVQNTSNGYISGVVSPPFTGYQIVDVTGTYYDKIEDKTFNVLGLYAAGSFEGGIPPAIPHYASDNLFAVNVVNGALSGGGIVVSTDNPAYQYHLFTDPVTGDYAGCGSGTCKKVTRMVPGPLPLVGAAAAFGLSRRLRRRMQVG